MKIFSRLLIICGALMCGTMAAVAENTPAEMSAQVADRETPTVRVVAGGVEVSINGDADRVLEVYALTGQVVKKVTIHPHHAQTVELPAGYYILRVGRSSCRVAVR